MESGPQQRPASVPMMSGWLHKMHAGMMSGGDYRWVELHGTELRLFATDSEPVPNRIVNISRAAWTDGRKSASRLAFSLATPNDATAKQYRFACEVESDLAKWKSAIERAAQLDSSTESLPGANRPNLVALVNGKSGGKQGAALIQKIKKHLGDANVIDIMTPGPSGGILGPKGAMNLHAKSGDNTRFLVCGGDGTVGWALQDMEKLKLSGVITEDIAISVLPLGTGNDMARTLGCGGGYSGEKMLPILRNCAQGEQQRLDRWKVKLTVQGEGGQEDKEYLMCNYFSIGWDAMIARCFHCLRETKPHLFKNRAINKAWYFYYSMANLVGNMDCSKGGLTLIVDGKTVAIPKGVVSINVVNIPSYSGGTNLWGTRAGGGFQPQRTDDGLLEIVGYTGPLHMGRIRFGVQSGIRVAQGREVMIRTEAPHQGGPDAVDGICCQVDGEPYFVDYKGFHEDARYAKAQKPCPPNAKVDITCTITHHAVATLVAAPAAAPGCSCG